MGTKMDTVGRPTEVQDKVNMVKSLFVGGGRAARTAVIAALLTAGVNYGFPQLPRSAPRSHSARVESKQKLIDLRVEKLSKQLSLNEIQRFDLKKLLQAQQTESNRLWSDPKIEPMDRMMKLRALQENTQKRFSGMLTSQQREKYDALVKAAEERRKILQTPTSQTPHSDQQTDVQAAPVSHPASASAGQTPQEAH